VVSSPDVPARIGDLPAIGRPANRALLAAGISTLEQVAALSRDQLLAMHGVGPRAVAILESALAEQDLTLGT
jgi:Helix-hairpin-helix domain